MMKPVWRDAVILRFCRPAFLLACMLILPFTPAMSRQNANPDSQATIVAGGKTSESSGARARVTVNRENPEATKGFVYFPTVTCKNATSSGTVESFLRDLSNTLADYTEIEVRFDGPVSLDSPKLKKYPIICFIPPPELTPGEERGLQDYLTSGGFVLISQSSMRVGPIHDFLSKFTKLGVIPESHPVYRALYDATAEGKTPGGSGRLSGIMIGDRLVGVGFDSFISRLSSSAADEGNKRIVTNVIVYALKK